MISGETRLLGVMGHPVRHSLSPAMHNASFASLGLDFVYVALPVAPESLSEAVRGAASLGFRGFNLTMPHKEAVVPLLDGLDETAAISGAVNTVVLDDSGLSTGYNTDGFGMVEACREAGAVIPGATVALIGAGGAATAISLAMKRADAGLVQVFNRNTRRSEELVRKLLDADAGGGLEARPSDELAAASPDILVNATPLGMRDDDPLPVPDGHLETLDSKTIVADAVYRPGSRTRFTYVADALGLRTVAGQRMLLYQGVEAQRLWTGVEPDIGAMDAALSG